MRNAGEGQVSGLELAMSDRNLQSAHFGRILAAYGGIFVAGSLIWGWVADGYRPDHFDITGALICLAGMGVVTYAPRRH